MKVKVKTCVPVVYQRVPVGTRTGTLAWKRLLLINIYILYVYLYLYILTGTPGTLVHDFFPYGGFYLFFHFSSLMTPSVCLLK